MEIRLDGSVWLILSLMDEMDGLYRALLTSSMSLLPGDCRILLPSSSSSDLSTTIPRKLGSDRVPGFDLSTLQGVVSGSLPFEGLLSLAACSKLEDGQDRGDEDRLVFRALYVLHRGSSVSPVDAPVTSTSNSRTCCGNRATIVGPSARTSMNLNRAILPCPLDLPVTIASTRRNIHLTVCQASTCAYASLIQFFRPGTNLFHFAPPLAFSPLTVDIQSEIQESSGIRKTATFVDRAAHTHARLISHGDTTSRNSWEFSANRYSSQRYVIARNAPGMRCRNDGIFVLFSLLFFLFFSIERDLIRWLYINRPAAFSRTVAAIGPRSKTRYLCT